MAVWRYPNAKPLFHSDRGFQYTSKQFKARLDAAGMTQSMSRVGRFAAVKDFIYFYNHRRRQRRLDKLAPADYRSLFFTAA